MGSVGPVTRVGNGVFTVEVDGRTETVFVAGPAHDRWLFWNGRVFRGDFRENRSGGRYAHRAAGLRALTAPMPATIVKIHVKPGDAVAKGQTLMLLEAMKMELPIRAPGDGLVSAVHGREGQLVAADALLVEFAA